MSRPRSRSPVYSRIPTLHGRRGEGITHNQTHSSSFPDMWRNPDNNRESNTNRNKDSYQGEQQIDHWTRFINVIEHAQKSAPSLEPRYNTQPVQEKSTSSPRRLPREKLPSPDHTCLGVGEHYRLPSPGWNRNEPVEREPSSDRHLREMRGRSYPRHPEEKRRDRIDYGYPNECGNRFHERGSISERSSKSDYKDHHPSKGLNDVSLQDEFARHRRTSPFGTPVIVEHDHGITKHGSRDRDRQDMGGYSRNRDQRNRDPERNRRDQGHHSHPSQDYRQGARFYGNPREETRKNYSSYRRESQGRERSRHIDQFKMDSHSRDSEGRKRMHFRESSEANLWTKKRNPVNEWEEERMQRNQERMMDEEEAHHRAQRNRNLESNVGSPPKMEFCKQETLKIKVDMSRPIMQASYSGYSSDRQLSLDLVNVGRQRVDFLPMLEHSGTYRESAVHCGTFAEEIISLVHHVKEHFFRGQGITLNERFGNEMDYSVQDVFIEGGEVEQEEVLTNRPPLNRSQIRPLLEGLIQKGSDVGDLRFDLERRRQQLLESVKITIAGGGFPQESLEGQERGSPYVSDVDDQQEIDEWFGQEQSQPFQANTPHQERPTLTRRYKKRGYFRRYGRKK